MSVARPLRCLFAIPRRRQFSTSAAPLSQKSLAPSTPSNPNPQTAPYTQEQLSILRKFYSRSQLAALLAGESAIDRSHFASRIDRDPHDPYALPYLDDLSTHDPILDFSQVQGAYKPTVGYPQQPLPVIDDPRLSFPSADEATETRYRDLSRLTGYTIQQIREFRTKTMVVHSVTNQTRMGKIRKMYTLVVAGNGNGLLGIGEGKSAEAEDAIRQAQYMAIRNMEPIPRYEGRTIFGDVFVKVGAVELKLMTRPPGYGVRCSQYVFEMCRCLGIQDLSARVTRSRNPMNVVKATLQALKSQKLPETIARGRGMKIVDVRKVYYDGHA